jgi:hypothetical protein
LNEKFNILFLNSSSDSDSDPEGGELPDIVYKKEEQTPKKKLKKKRTEKAIDERVPKIARKREVNNYLIL